MVTCNRCGLCCNLVNDNGELTDKRCRYCKDSSDGKTICVIYNIRNRLGKKLGHGNVCIRREDDTHNYPGCPYNKEEYGMIKLEDGLTWQDFGVD